MEYKIKKATIEFSGEKISKITTQWEDRVGSDGKMIYKETFVENKPIGGYMFLTGKEILSPELLQKVCGQGMYTIRKYVQ